MKIYALCTADTMSRNTGGKLYHAHDHDAREGQGPARCGMKPGRRGYWSSYFGKEVTCPRCLKILKARSDKMREDVEEYRREKLEYHKKPGTAWKK